MFSPIDKKKLNGFEFKLGQQNIQKKLTNVLFAKNENLSIVI